MQIAVESNILQNPIVKSDQLAKSKQKSHEVTSDDNLHNPIASNDFLALLLNQLLWNVPIATKGSEKNTAVNLNHSEVKGQEGTTPSLLMLKQLGNKRIDAEQLQQLQTIFDEIVEQQSSSNITQSFTKNRISQNEIKIADDNTKNLLEYLKIFESAGIKIDKDIWETSPEEPLRLLPDLHQSLRSINREDIQKAIVRETADRKNFPEINISKRLTPNFENFEQSEQKLPKQNINQVLKGKQEKVEIATEQKISKVFDVQPKDFSFFVKDARNVIETASAKLPEPLRVDYQSHRRIFYSRFEEIPQNIASMLNSSVEFPARAEIVLNPKTFGMIIVEINASKNKVEVMFNVQDKEVLKMLENQTAVLREKLQNAGFDNQNIDLQYKSFDKGEATYQWNQEQKQSEQELMRGFIRSFAYLKENNELDFENYLQNKLEAL